MSCPWKYADPSPVENGKRLVCCMECGSLLRIPEANDPAKIGGCRLPAFGLKPKERPWLHNLGDYTAVALAKMGVTAERYKAAKKAIGLKDSCNCPKRIESLNQAGKAISDFGEAASSLIQSKSKE